MRADASRGRCPDWRASPKSSSRTAANPSRTLAAVPPTLKRGYADAVMTVDVGGAAVEQLAQLEGITANNA
jgi:hypothetical protein